MYKRPYERERAEMRAADTSPPSMEYGEAYVPIQPWGVEQYTYAEALARGTLWPVLYKPYPRAR